MASSRLERIGTIYTRVKGLIRSGAMKPEERPLWYDVYESFPPKEEPKFGRQLPVVPVRKIFYSEDAIRAKFYKKFGSPGMMKINEKDTTANVCQKFVEKYQELQSSYSDDEQLIEAAAEEVEAKGFYIRRSNKANQSISAAYKKSLADSEAAAETDPSSAKS